MRRLLIGVSAWLPALACHTRFVAGLEPHDMAARFGTLALHVETVVDVPA